MENVHAPIESCMAADCSYTKASTETLCSPGGSNCSFAFLRESQPMAAGNPSGGDPPIRVTTRKVNALLRALAQNPPAGFQLAILWTPGGAMLDWVRHIEAAPPSGVTFASGREANEAAFNLIPVDEMTFDDVDGEPVTST